MCKCKSLWNFRGNIAKYIGLNCKRRGKHWWNLEEKLQLENKKKVKKSADCIKTMCNVGFGPSLHKIK